MKKFILGILSIVVVFSLAACGEKTPVNSGDQQPSQVTETSNVSEQTEQSDAIVNVPKDQQIGTAGSNMPLKDREEDAKYEIQVAMQYLLEEAYGDKVFDARFKDIKIYSGEDEKNNNLEVGMDEVAFEINYELRPSADTDPNELTAGTGEYDEESGWVINKSNLGILTPTNLAEGEEGPKYKIRDFGTGW